jgi:membrane protease YdiL (CAAX protease family)
MYGHRRKEGIRMARPGLIDSLTHASFPYAVDARDRHAGWHLATIALGLMAGFLCALGVMFNFLFSFPALMGVLGHGSEGRDIVARFMQLAQNGNLPITWRDAVSSLLLVSILNSVVFAAPVFVAAMLGRRPFRIYLTAAPQFRWRLMGSAMLLMAVVLLPLFILGEFIDPSSGGGNGPAGALPVLSLAPDFSHRAVFVLVAFAALIPAAAVEEILFRGWLLRVSRAAPIMSAILPTFLQGEVLQRSLAFFRGPFLAMAVNAVLFALMHLNPNLDDNFQLGMMGAAFCYMAYRFGGIEFAIGAHAINNILIVLFFEPLSLASARPHAPAITTIVAALVIFALCVGVTELVLRNATLRRLTGAEPEPQPALAPVEAFS